MRNRQTLLALLALISSPLPCASSEDRSVTTSKSPRGDTLLQQHRHPPLSKEDTIRASLNKPPSGSHVLATDPKQTVASVLNRYLRQTLSPDKIRPCDAFDVEELNDVLAALVESSHPSLQEIYASKKCDEASERCDKRSMRHQRGVAGYREEWQEEMDTLHGISDESVRAVVESVLRKGKCFEAVQLYYHHLSEESRQQFQPPLPLLPDNQDDIKILARLSQQYKGMTKHDPSQGHAEANMHQGHHHHRSLQTSNVTDDGDDGGADAFDTIFYQDDVHTNTFSKESLNAKTKFLSDVLGPGSGFEGILADLMAKYNTQSPCAMSHRVIAKPWTVESAEDAGVSVEVATFIAEQLQNDTFNTGGVPSEDYPDTAIPGAGYVPCDQADVCLEGGDRKYMVQAAVRSYVVPGSSKIQRSNSATPNGADYAFHTRTFEGMPESPSKFGPDAAGGDGTLGLLGPAIVANPGERVHIFVKNNLADTSALGPNVPTPLDFWKRIQVIRNITNTTRYFLNVSYNGPEWPDDEYPFEGTEPLPPDEMMATAGLENVPGLTTGGYDIFNIHMHGWEVAPHLFHPQGTSNPAAPWISVSPDEASGQQCYCYRHTISETQSRGDYLYHTHRHGTTTELTWGGMFGLSLTGEESVEEARSNATSAATLNRDLVSIADAEGLAFDDSDVNIMVIYDSVWSLSNITTENNETSVVVTDFISGFRSTTGIHPYFVNNEYQPTFQARTGALSVFRLACVSAGNLCAFMILEGTNKTENSTIIPFDRVASDGISYASPVHREGNGNPLIPDLTNTEAYLSMGGGMREVVVAQFPRAGKYEIWMLSNAFDDGNEQLLATVNVTGDDASLKDITGYTLKSARPSIESRPVDEYRGMTFKTNYDQEAYPFPMYGIGDVNGENASAYNLTEFDIGAKGRTCGIWVIRSMDIVLHPFHIHVNPFMILSQKSHWDDNPDLQLFISDYTLPFDVDKGTALQGIWRDTAIVPPYGYLVIKQCYDAGTRPSLGEDVSTFAGKFVFHCHFLVHEDTGLIRNIILSSNASSTTPTSGSSTVASGRLLMGSMALVASILFVL